MMNKKEATIYDYVRMCKKNIFCDDCPIYDGEKDCDFNSMNDLELEAANEKILKWCEEHPVITRQDRFLKIFPNPEFYNGVIDICPKRIDKTIKCCGRVRSCNECKRNYWLAESEER